MEPLAFLLAGVIGLTLGLLGAGGSILTVPVFVYVLGFAAKPAIAMSLPVVGTTSLVGAIGHWRAGNVHLRTALLFGAIAMAGSFAGARIGLSMSADAQLTLLGITVLAAALSMLRSRGAATGLEDAADGATRSPLVIAASALGVGVLTGIAGVGGGFLIVPALVLLARVPIRHAVGTSLVVIAMNAASGAVGYAGDVDIPWGFAIAFSAVAIGGILVGTWLARFVPPLALRRAFALFLLALGAAILYANRAFLTPSASPPDPQASPSFIDSPGETSDVAQATL